MTLTSECNAVTFYFDSAGVKDYLLMGGLGTDCVSGVQYRYAALSLSTSTFANPLSMFTSWS